MTDDEVQNYVHAKMFGDLDNIEAGSLFSDDKDAVSGTADNAKPESEMSGGVTITVKPIMAAAQEGGKPSDTAIPGTDDENEDDIASISPLMRQLHGKK